MAVYMLLSVYDGAFSSLMITAVGGVGCFPWFESCRMFSSWTYGHINIPGVELFKRLAGVNVIYTLRIKQNIAVE